MLYRWLANAVRLRESRPFDVRAVLAVVAFVGVTRAVLEGALCSGTITSPESVVGVVTFYLLAAFLFTAAGALLTRQSWQGVMQVVPLGIFVGVLPPFIDRALGIEACRYGYSLGFFSTWTWQIYSTANARELGETAALWATVAFFGLYVWMKTRSLGRTVLALAVGYALVFVIMTLAGSTAFHLVREYARGPVPSRFRDAGPIALACTIDLALVTAVWLALRPPLARRLLPRLLHAAPFVAVLLLGAAAASFEQRGGPGPIPLVHAVVPAVWLLLAWLANLTQNDHYDADTAAPPSRDDVWLLTAVAWVAAAAAVTVDARLGGLLAIFNITVAVYNHPFYRAKRWFPANYKIEGVWGWSAFMLGACAVSSHQGALPGGTLAASGLVFGGWSVFNALKDYKDIRADRRAGVQTAYVLAHRFGWGLRRFHLALRWALLLGALIPVAAVAALGMPWWVPAAGLLWAAALFATLGQGPRTSTVRLALVLITGYALTLAAGLVA